jgi:multidrug efflux pump subunit AcrA (membrane-fusion protein)
MTVDLPATDHEPNRGLGRPIAQSADPIDRVVRLAPKWTVFVLLACGLLVLGTIIWALVGTVTSSVSTPALYTEQGSANVVATRAEKVDRILVTVGQQVTEGQRLLTLAGGATQVSPQDGTITAILVSEGSAMWPGKTSVVVTDLAEPDEVVTLVPAAMTGTVVVGLPVRMEVSTAPSSKYGYLLGTIDEISHAPYTVEQTAEKLGFEKQVVAAELGGEPALLATIKLDYDPSTASNYRWSVGQGPPFVLTQGMAVTAEIILKEQHPLGLVFGGVDRRGS